MGDSKIKRKNIKKLIESLQSIGAQLFVKNQSKHSYNLNQQIQKFSNQLNQLRGNQNRCNQSFQSIEKTFSDYKVWSEQRKALIRDRIATVERKGNMIRAIMSDQSHPAFMQRMGHTMYIRRSIVDDCKLPD